MKPGHGIPSRDAFSGLSKVLGPEGQRQALARFAAGRARRPGPGAVAINGLTLRRSFEDSSKRSQLHMVSALAVGAS